VVASWVRRDFSGVGVTQYPPGRYLAAIQDRLGGHALLCIDVSSSMAGAPLKAAVAGGLDFLTEAGAASYRCGLVLWNHHVVAHLPAGSPERKLRGQLRRTSASGGTALAPALRAAVEELTPLAGDRVICVFSDGGIADRGAVTKLAEQARARGIRFVVRGLGKGVGDHLAELLTPLQRDESQNIHDVADLRGAIASMAATLRVRR
jgi:Mg-chelatase subunit ChlD